MKTMPLLLVAEDDPDDQLLIQDAIETVCSPDLNTRFVWDGVELIELLQKGDGRSKPGLIILDLNMPRKDGRTALREIKADPNLAGIPVVVLTTSVNESDAEFCEQNGIAGYYRKPSSMHELREIIGSLCSKFC